MACKSELEYMQTEKNLQSIEKKSKKTLTKTDTGRKVMSKHPMTQQMVVVQRGEKEGLVVKIHGSIHQQFQGKDVKSIRQNPSMSAMITLLESRGHQFTSETLFCSVVNTPDSFMLVDESEIKLEAETKPKLGLIDGGKDDSGRADQTDNSNVESNGSEQSTSGRSISSSESIASSTGQEADSTEASGIEGSGDGAAESGDSQPEEPAATKKPTKPRKPTSK